MKTVVKEIKETKKSSGFWEDVKKDILSEYSRWQTFYNSLPMRLFRNMVRIAGYAIMIVILVYPETRPVFRHYADVLISYLL